MKYSAAECARVAALAGILISGSNLTLGSDDGSQWADDDHVYDRARRAVANGETLPVAELLKLLQIQVAGEVVDMEFGQEHGRWVYEFKLIDSGGRLREVYVDAQTGTVLSMEDD